MVDGKSYAWLSGYTYVTRSGEKLPVKGRSKEFLDWLDSQDATASNAFRAGPADHVEAQTGAFMWERDLTKLRLLIDNPVVCVDCLKHVPNMLPPGSTLEVVTSTGTFFLRATR